MLGLNLFNIFSTQHYFETTTILWLRLISLIIVLAGAYVTYIAKDSTLIKSIGIILIIAGSLSLLVYLLYGYSFSSGSCVYCPSPPSRVTLENSQRGTLQKNAPLPKNNPFRHTILYYTVIDDVSPLPENTPSKDRAIITRNDLYDITLDSTTGNLGVSYIDNGTRYTKYFGKYPLQTFAQIAIVQEGKETRVFVNGIPRGAFIRNNLPPTSSMSSSYIFNSSSVIKTGMIYQVEVHQDIMDQEAMLNSLEKYSIHYDNETTYQNTRYPTSLKQNNMSFTEKVLGNIRLISSLFGYNRGVDTATRDITLFQN